MHHADVKTAGFVFAARLDELEAALPHGVILPNGARVCLVKVEDEVLAVDDRCPHRDFGISGGDLVGPCVIECPWHGARFDLRTGAVLQGPATDDLGTYPVRIAGSDIFVGPRRGS